MDLVGLIIFLVVGGVIGWLASIVMKRDASQGIILNIVVGIVGSFIGSWVGSLIGVGAGPLASFSAQSLIMAFVGACILLAIVNLIYRGKAR